MIKLTLKIQEQVDGNLFIEYIAEGKAETPNENDAINLLQKYIEAYTAQVGKASSHCTGIKREGAPLTPEMIAALCEAHNRKAKR